MRLQHFQSEPINDWWRLFQDPLLDKYIAKAAIYNKEILIACDRVIEARVQKQIAASALYPQINFDLNVTRLRFSKNGPFFDFINGAAAAAASTIATGGTTPAARIVQTLFNLFFDASWEVDIFGKTRRSIEVAEATTQSQIEARNDILLTVLGEAAKAYMNDRGYQKQRILTENNLALLYQIKTITDNRAKGGLDNALNQHNIDAEVADLESTLPTIIRQIYINIYSLSVLLGFPPECLLGVEHKQYMVKHGQVFRKCAIGDGNRCLKSI